MSKNQNKFPFAYLALALFIGLGVAAVYANSKADEKSEQAIAPASAPAPISDPAPASETSATAEFTDTELAKMTTPRILGNPDAPVKISEHSSFTCSHCAEFHHTNFEKIKAEYIDTGKAYLVFDDFPRNEVDIIVGSLARCLDGDAYFNFVQLVFKTQSNWGNADYRTHIKQNAIIAGIPSDKADACMDNQTVHESLAAHRQTAQDKFNINSTPNLVIDDQIVIPGLSAYEEIKKQIDAEFAKKAPKAE